MTKRGEQTRNARNMVSGNKTVLGNGCGNCMCFHPEFAPLPEIMEETVAEAELEAFDEAWFAIQQTLTEEEARLWW